MLDRKAWAIITRKEKKSRQHVGLWHETCVAPEGGYESIYADIAGLRPGRGHRCAVDRRTGPPGRGAARPPVRVKKTAATTLGRPAGDGEGERRARGQPLRRRASVSRAAESMTAWACIRPG